MADKKGVDLAKLIAGLSNIEAIATALAKDEAKNLNAHQQIQVDMIRKEANELWKELKTEVQRVTQKTEGI